MQTEGAARGDLAATGPGRAGRSHHSRTDSKFGRMRDVRYLNGILRWKSVSGHLAVGPDRCASHTARQESALIRPMLDRGSLRQDFDAIKRRLGGRADPALLDEFVDTDLRRRAAVTGIQVLQQKRNELSALVAAARRAGDDALDLVKESRDVHRQIRDREQEVNALDEALESVLSRIPNVPHASVPPGEADAANVEVGCWGQVPEFPFPPKPHWDLGVHLGIIDFERATKLAGARFAVYRNAGAKLERALMNFMLDVHTSEHGYCEILPPFIANSKSLFGTGQLPKFAQDLFRLEGTDYWLVPTAEVPLTNLYAGETLSADNLPLSLTAFTPCFRSEAGSYGRDVRGVIRQHQFQKVELVKIADPATSYDELERLTSDAEDILRRLGLPYRKMVLSSGDMGFSAAKTYDLEVWLPGLGEFKEISSCSNFEAFQARRAGIRFRRMSGRKSRPEFVHTLNGSGLAIGRTWLAIVENYQQADGSIVVPEALRTYLNAERIDHSGNLV